MLTYEHEVISPPAGFDASAISIDSATRTMTYYTTSTALADTYHIQIFAVNNGVRTATFVQYSVEFKDPCLDATLTINPSILTSTNIQY